MIHSNQKRTAHTDNDTAHIGVIVYLRYNSIDIYEIYANTIIILIYRYSLDVVATSHELYSSFGMQLSAGRGWRGEVRDEKKYLVLRGPRGIFYRYFFSSSSRALFPLPALSFFSWSRPAERTIINERIKTLSPYYSLRLYARRFFRRRPMKGKINW